MKTGLHLAVENGNFPLAIAYCRAFEARARDLVNARDAVGRTPLHFAASVANCDIIQLLLSYGADVNAKTLVYR